jgi:hypothetical protein
MTSVLLILLSGVAVGFLCSALLLWAGGYWYRASAAEHKQKAGYLKLKQMDRMFGHAKIVDGRFVCRDCKAPLTDRNFGGRT